MAITLRTTTAMDEMLSALKEYTRIPTTTKALLHCAENYPPLRIKSLEQSVRIAELERQLENVHLLMKDRQEIDQKLASLTAQKSLY